MRPRLSRIEVRDARSAIAVARQPSQPPESLRCNKWRPAVCVASSRMRRAMHTAAQLFNPWRSTFW